MLFSILMTTLVGDFSTPISIDVGPLYSAYYEAQLVSGGKYQRRCDYSDHCSEEISDSQTITIPHSLIVMRTEVTNRFYDKVMNKKRLRIGTSSSDPTPRQSPQVFTGLPWRDR